MLKKNQIHAEVQEDMCVHIYALLKSNLTCFVCGSFKFQKAKKAEHSKQAGNQPQRNTSKERELNLEFQ